MQEPHAEARFEIRAPFLADRHGHDQAQLVVPVPLAGDRVEHKLRHHAQQVGDGRPAGDALIQPAVRTEALHQMHPRACQMRRRYLDEQAVYMENRHGDVIDIVRRQPGCAVRANTEQVHVSVRQQHPLGRAGGAAGIHDARDSILGGGKVWAGLAVTACLKRLPGLDGGFGQVALVLLELRFETLEQGKRIGGTAGETGQHLAAI